MTRVPRVLSIAGTDPTGGAGIQADLKSIAAMGGFGMAVVTALVAQNTQGVREVHVPPVDFLTAQLDAVSDDVVIDAVKIGMLQSVAVIDAVREWLGRVRPPVVVLDPVMVATSGDGLLEDAAHDALRRLCREVDLLTPNLAELAALTGGDRATSWAAALEQAHRLRAATGAAVLLKGGHLDDRSCPDAIVDGGVVEISGERVLTRHTHGTGCSLSSAMATLRAAGAPWPDALRRAKEWLTGAIRHAEALEVGRGSGPVDHFHEMRAATSAPSSSWAGAAWEEAAGVRAEVDACAFVVGLRDGTLPRETFRRYLAQDALYLESFARMLARASALAPSPAEQVFWARCVESAVLEERRLHEAHADWAEVAPAEQTRAYTNHLHASSDTYGELVAALLPCFRLYTDLGDRFSAHRHDGHPYDDWLKTYADPDFAEATRVAEAFADAAARDAGPSLRERMRVAYARSMEHELDFFVRA